MIVKIDPNRIRIDCNTQSRVALNESVIAEYAEAMERGETFPPILVFFNEQDEMYILADGFHRLHAHLRALPNDLIASEQRIGTIEDAVWESLAANQTHGLRRTGADKRNAVKMALMHPKGIRLSDREIARHVGVDHKTVANMRYDLNLSGEIPQIETRIVVRGTQVYQQKVRVSDDQNPKSCGQCLNYEASEHKCMLDDTLKTPWDAVCDEFDEAPAALPPESVEPVPADYNLIEPETRNRKTRRRNHYDYKPRNTISIDVPIDNPDLTIIELRHVLGAEYLAHCIAAYRAMSLDRSDED